ncbi:hypothetical protein ACN28G_28745 [Micromonospora sp. WMMA1923]|uniref:hypothetical protein n=1 Tax=Micromonospora sp. WMMA1923 TaxID=3404125 RepID=UPI003B93DED8
MPRKADSNPASPATYWENLGEFIMKHLDEPANWKKPLPASATSADGTTLHPDTAIKNVLNHGSYPPACPPQTQDLINNYLRVGAIDVGSFGTDAHIDKLIARKSPSAPTAEIAALRSAAAPDPGQTPPTTATRPAATDQQLGASGPRQPHGRN